MAANTVQSSSALSDEARLAMMADERRGLMAQAHRAQQASESSLGFGFPTSPLPLFVYCFHNKRRIALGTLSLWYKASGYKPKSKLIVP